MPDTTSPPIAANVAGKFSPPGGRRRGRAEVEQRLARIETLMLDGADRGEVIRTMASERIPERTVDDYIRRVRQRWIADSHLERPYTRVRQLRRMYRHLRILLAAGRHREVLACEKAIGELEGNAPTPSQRDGTDCLGRRRHSLTDEQVTYMAENQGRLPEGVSLDDLGGW